VVTAASVSAFYSDAYVVPVAEDASWKDYLMKFDPFGVLALVAMVVSLLLALQWGGSEYAWSESPIIALLVLFVILIPAYISIEYWQQEKAIMPLRLMKQRTMASCAWFTFWQASTLFSVLFYLPLWFQAVQGATAVESGIKTIPMLVSMVLASMLAASLPALAGYYTPLFWISSVLTSVGAGLLSMLTTDTSFRTCVAYQITFGLGVGCGLPVTNLAIQTVVPSSLIPVGIATNLFFQMFGGAIFVSVAQSILTNSLLQGILTTVPGVSSVDIISAGATELVDVVPQKYLLAVKLVYNAALVKTFYVSIAGACLSTVGAAFVEWKSVKQAEVDDNVS
jgi:hypothetical protein